LTEDAEGEGAGLADPQLAQVDVAGAAVPVVGDGEASGAGALEEVVGAGEEGDGRGDRPGWGGAAGVDPLGELPEVVGEVDDGGGELGVAGEVAGGAAEVAAQGPDLGRAGAVPGDLELLLAATDDRGQGLEADAGDELAQEGQALEAVGVAMDGRRLDRSGGGHLLVGEHAVVIDGEDEVAAGGAGELGDRLAQVHEQGGGAGAAGLGWAAQHCTVVADLAGQRGAGPAARLGVLAGDLADQRVELLTPGQVGLAAGVAAVLDEPLVDVGRLFHGAGALGRGSLTAAAVDADQRP
jgi:hypothetical protein